VWRKTGITLLIYLLGSGANQALAELAAPNAVDTAYRAGDSQPISEVDVNFPPRTVPQFSTGEFYRKLALSVVLVLALGASALYVSRRFLPRIANLPGKKIRVVETVYLGPRKAVHLIEVEDQRLLIGSTSEMITKLADISKRSSSFAETLGQDE